MLKGRVKNDAGKQIECKACGRVLKDDTSLVKHVTGRKDHPTIKEYREYYSNCKKYFMDYIIPICNMGDNSFDYRLRNLEALIRIIPPFVNLVIVEQIVDTTKKLYINNIREPEKINIDKQIVRHPIFNKPWLYNIGVNMTRTDKIFLAEGDINTNRLYFGDLFTYIYSGEGKHLDWFFAWDEIIYWDEQFKNKARVDSPRPGMAEGGVVYFNKDFYWKIGGANEWLQELGGIDNELSLRAKFVSGYYLNFKWTINHLWHPISHVKKDGWKYATHRLNNRRIFYKVKENPQKMIDILRENKIGIPTEPICKSKDLNL